MSPAVASHLQPVPPLKMLPSHAHPRLAPQALQPPASSASQLPSHSPPGRRSHGLSTSGKRLPEPAAAAPPAGPHAPPPVQKHEKIVTLLTVAARSAAAAGQRARWCGSASGADSGGRVRLAAGARSRAAEQQQRRRRRARGPLRRCTPAGLPVRFPPLKQKFNPITDVVQRRGIGSAMLRQVQAYVTRTACLASAVTLRLRAPLALRLFFERAGYSAVAVAEGGAVAMQLTLPRCAAAAPASCLATAALATTWCGNKCGRLNSLVLLTQQKLTATPFQRLPRWLLLPACRSDGRRQARSSAGSWGGVGRVGTRWMACLAPICHCCI